MRYKYQPIAVFETGTLLNLSTLGLVQVASDVVFKVTTENAKVSIIPASVLLRHRSDLGVGSRLLKLSDSYKLALLRLDQKPKRPKSNLCDSLIRSRQ